MTPGIELNLCESAPGVALDHFWVVELRRPKDSIGNGDGDRRCNLTSLQ